MEKIKPSVKLGPIPKATSPAVHKSMKGNKGKDTKPEMTFRKALFAGGIRGYRLHWKKVPGRPDIAFPGKKIAIFVNGCFWHRCPLCDLPFPKNNQEFWKAKFIRNVERDKLKIKQLTNIGWTVLIIWECQIKHDIDTQIQRVVKTLGTKS